MTELEQFAATLLMQWRADGGAADAAIGVSALLDKVFPYRVARRTLGIDVSEDYEALVLRLLAEDEDLVRVEPVSAADMAKATITSRLPDLDALQLLRSARLTFTERAIARLDGGSAHTEASSRTEATPPVAEDPSSRAPATQRVAAVEAPQSPRNKDVIPLYPTHAPVTQAAPAEPPPEFLATVTFTPPAATHCWSCSDPLPLDRATKFCPFCGADQRQPTCAACGAAAERGWKHCPECGAKL
jgi:hypothetical protein